MQFLLSWSLAFPIDNFIILFLLCFWKKALRSVSLLSVWFALSVCVSMRQRISSLFELLITIYQFNSFSLGSVTFCFGRSSLKSNIFLCVWSVVVASVVYAAYRQKFVYFLHIQHKLETEKKNIQMKRRNHRSKVHHAVRNAHSIRIQCDNFEHRDFAPALTNNQLIIIIFGQQRKRGTND